MLRLYNTKFWNLNSGVDNDETRCFPTLALFTQAWVLKRERGGEGLHQRKKDEGGGGPYD